MPASLRNPMAGTAITLGEALVLGLGVCLPTLLIPIFELRLLYLGFAFLFVGMVAGRESIAGFLGFAGAFVGASLATGLWFALLGWLGMPLPLGGWDLLVAVAYGAFGGAGGTITGKLGIRRLQRMVDRVPRNRTCDRCGSRVGLASRKCWSCKATLRF